MDKEARRKFRKSVKWRNFRAECKKKCGGRDWLTGRPLRRDWNLHHMDLCTDRYDDLSDMSKFIPLNKDTHEVLHWLYSMNRRSPGLLERMSLVIIAMEDATNVKD